MAQYDDVAADYARLIAPKYAPIARVVADRVVADQLPRDVRVLEVAAGTGLLTSLLVPELPPTTRYLATDVAVPMLVLAREGLGAVRIGYAAADVRALPLSDRSTDVVVSSLGPVQEDTTAFAEALRVLVPGGRLVLGFWGTGYSELAMLKAARGALGLGEFPAQPVEAATTRCVEAGFGDVRTTTSRLEVTHASLTDYLAYRRSFGWPPWIPEERRPEWFPAIEAATAEYVGADGRVRFDWSIVVLEARRPA